LRFIEASRAPQDDGVMRCQPSLHSKQSAGIHPQKEKNMRKFLMAVALGAAMLMEGSSVKAQVDLSAYADPEGFLDVQTLTCAQLAGTWQGQADLLTAWYSGWYNGLAKKHYMDITKGREAEHEVIVYCKANPEIRVIQAMDIVFKSMRERMGIKVQ
jgi:hypothetical protein